MNWRFVKDASSTTLHSLYTLLFGICKGAMKAYYSATLLVFEIITEAF